LGSIKTAAPSSTRNRSFLRVNGDGPRPRGPPGPGPGPAPAPDCAGSLVELPLAGSAAVPPPLPPPLPAPPLAATVGFALRSPSPGDDGLVGRPLPRRTGSAASASSSRSWSESRDASGSNRAARLRAGVVRTIAPLSLPLYRARSASALASRYTTGAT